MDAERGDRSEPEEHDRTEGAADPGGPERLDGEQDEQDERRRRQHDRLQARGDLLDAFEGRQHRDRRRDRAVAVDERGAEQADGDDDRPPLLLDAEQGHQGDDAALPVVVDPHGEVDVLDGGDEEERPQDQRQRAEHGRRVRMGSGVVEHGFQRVERARADVAEHHAERGEAGEGGPAGRRRLVIGRFARHSPLPGRKRRRPDGQRTFEVNVPQRKTVNRK